jgi:hypothetical protein
VISSLLQYVTAHIFNIKAKEAWEVMWINESGCKYGKVMCKVDIVHGNFT